MMLKKFKSSAERSRIN